MSPGSAYEAYVGDGYGNMVKSLEELSMRDRVKVVRLIQREVGDDTEGAFWAYVNNSANSLSFLTILFKYLNPSSASVPFL